MGEMDRGWGRVDAWGGAWVRMGWGGGNVK